MIATFIGLTSSLICIFIISQLKRIDKNILYGLILMGIAFLYIGYTWTNIETVIINALQAVFFLIFAYLGIKKSVWFLVAGYFLHGIWDFVYSGFASPDLLPPDYDFFCLTFDFVVAFYLLIINIKAKNLVVKT